jgi:hypothetical protein
VAGSARTAAALFGLVTAVLAVARVGVSLAAGEAPYVLLLFPLVVLQLAHPVLLAATSAVTLVGGRRGRLAARAAGVLLAGTVASYLPLVVLTSAGVVIGATLPAAAAVVLLLTSRGSETPEQRLPRGSAGWLGRALLLAVTGVAMVWAAVALASMTGGGGPARVTTYTGVAAALSLAFTHASLAVLVPWRPPVVLVLAGVMDIAIGIGALPTQPISELGALLPAGCVLIALGVATRRHKAPSGREDAAT